MTGTGAIEPWTLVGSRTLIEDRWIKLRAETCRTADGVEVTPFYVLDYPDWVQVVALDDRDRILLVEQYRRGLDIVSLELPGGGVDPADADPIAAGMRELAEETGCTADDWELVACFAANPANQSNRCHTLVARGARIVAPPRLDPTEHIRTHWLPVDEAVRLAMGGGIVNAIHVAAIALAFGRMGRWRS